MKAEDYFTDPLQQKLAQAIARGDAEKISDVIKQGADVNAVGKDRMRPLFWAMAKRRLKEFEILLQHGADPNITAEKISDSDYPLALMELAAIAENPDYLRAALRYKGDPNFVVPASERSILYEAIMNERIHNVRLLVENGAKVNVRDSSGESPAMTAASINSYDIVYLLLEKGADPLQQDKWGYDLVKQMKKFGARGIAPESEQYQWYQKVSAELKKRGLLN